MDAHLNHKPGDKAWNCRETYSNSFLDKFITALRMSNCVGVAGLIACVKSTPERGGQWDRRVGVHPVVDMAVKARGERV